MEINYSLSPFTWGIDKVNKAFGKPDKRDLIVLFGYMSSWKTEFTYSVARKNIEQWMSVCYISLELPEYDMKLRIARKSAGIKKIDFQNWNFSDNQKAIMEATFDRLENTPWLYIIKPDTSDMLSIDRTMRKHYDIGCRMFVIDNLDKIQWDENDNSRYQQISSALQDFKNENNCCIILIHHAKKPFNKLQSYMPAGISWLRGSQKILDNATQVIEIFRDLDPETTDAEKSKVSLFQYKDTFEWANGFAEIYFNKGEYVDAL